MELTLGADGLRLCSERTVPTAPLRSRLRCACRAATVRERLPAIEPVISRQCLRGWRNRDGTPPKYERRAHRVEQIQAPVNDFAAHVGIQEPLAGGGGRVQEP